jgi:glycosyltransferase involved in cell wall biosynthesis
VRVVFDAFSVRRGTTAIVLENMLAGWTQLPVDDELVVLAGPASQFTAPPGVRVEVVGPPAGGSLWLRSFGVRRGCRDLGADVLVSLVTASALLGAPCPRAAVVYDLRHELRPHQFSRRRRLARRLSYAWTFRTADALCCISRRTRDDLVRTRPRLAGKAVVAALGGDHAARWSAPKPPERRYALAFGHFANKNADAVIEAWACRTDGELVLRLVGMSAADRAAAARRVAELGIEDRVELMPWLDDEQFRGCFAAASLIVFPSDFEGFGLPAAEAMWLGIPLVVSADPALAEVTGGHAVVARDLAPAALAAAMQQALDTGEEQLAAARRQAEKFQWRFTAEAVRSALLPSVRRQA